MSFESIVKRGQERSERPHNIHADNSKREPKYQFRSKTTSPSSSVTEESNPKQVEDEFIEVQYPITQYPILIVEGTQATSHPNNLNTIKESTKFATSLKEFA